MKRITRLFVLVCLVMAGRMAVANGDPVAIKSALTLSRTPVAVHVSEVQVVNEQCRFFLGSGYVDVEVRYTLHNRSKKDFKSLPYGFPIDWYGKGPARWVGTDIYSESVMERGWRDDYVRNVSFTLGGRTLAYKMSGDTVLHRAAAVCDQDYISEVMGETNPSLPGSDPLLSADSADNYFSAARVRQITAKYGDSLFYYDYDLCRRWYYCMLDIPAGQTVELTVRYRIENVCDYPLYSAAWVFNNGVIDNTFEYDFSPAAYWGNGRADRFRVEIDSTGIVVPDWAEVVVNCFNAKHTKKGWMYETSNFDFASSEPLRINYNAYGFDDATTLFKRRVNPSRYTVKLSGVDPKYPVDNMSDNDFSTTTVLRADSKGNTTIRIVFKDSTYVSGVMIYNGYTKNAEVWRNNSRIDGFSYSVNGMTESLYEAGFVMLYDDFIGKQISKGAPKSYTRQGLTDAAIKIPIANTVNIWGDQPLPKVKELTITIHKTKKGAKYDDLCVSEIVVLQ